MELRVVFYAEKGAIHGFSLGDCRFFMYSDPMMEFAVRAL